MRHRGIRSSAPVYVPGDQGGMFEFQYEDPALGGPDRPVGIFVGNAFGVL